MWIPRETSMYNDDKKILIEQVLVNIFFFFSSRVGVKKLLKRSANFYEMCREYLK